VLWHSQYYPLPTAVHLFVVQFVMVLQLVYCRCSVPAVGGKYNEMQTLPPALQLLLPICLPFGFLVCVTVCMCVVNCSGGGAPEPVAHKWYPCGGSSDEIFVGNYASFEILIGA